MRLIYNHTITAPASKSYLQRAIAIAALSRGICIITNYYPSNDAAAARQIVERMGAKTKLQNAVLEIDSRALDSAKQIAVNCGEAGLSARMFAPILASLYEKVVLTGEGSIQKRPMNMVAAALTDLGCRVETQDTFLPISIFGKIKPSEISLDGSESSQLLTGLLISLPLLDGDSVLHVQNLKSIPYIAMTIEILADFGIKIAHSDFKTFYITGNQTILPKKYTVEGDWSGAAFHLVGAAISGTVLLKGLNGHSQQADKAILTALKSCGATVALEEKGIRVTKSALNAFSFDATHCPDLFPPLAALAACCEGISTIIGTNRLKHKESDRALTIQTELKKLGINVVLTENTMTIQGEKHLKGGNTDSHNDHRIAMMLGVLRTVAHEAIFIENADAVAKSYPTFFDDLNASV